MKSYPIEKYAVFRSNGHGAVLYQHRAATAQKTDTTVLRLTDHKTVNVWRGVDGGLYDRAKVDKRVRFVRLTHDLYAA